MQLFHAYSQFLLETQNPLDTSYVSRQRCQTFFKSVDKAESSSTSVVSQSQMKTGFKLKSQHQTTRCLAWDIFVRREIWPRSSRKDGRQKDQHAAQRQIYFVANSASNLPGRISPQLRDNLGLCMPACRSAVIEIRITNFWPHCLVFTLIAAF